ncbi:uncharacterized protein HKW66_Vig0214160 [Vigna angularis]|uniref:Uncharacterized protein n=1 Tax=Phaseolus angularis TaxID=3914 RepID=A0A8T0JDF6_PHAAN|nr:uncharacterized protein LOC128194827 [Vigna angularis]KAG2371242.1 uncharacterized protein HKW66_Vig0214160 [Vigna angularis]
MANLNPLQLSALNQIKLHLLGEFSPLPITSSSDVTKNNFSFLFEEPNPTSSQSNSICYQSSTSHSFETMDHFFSDFLDFPTTSMEHQFSRFELESKPQMRSPHSESTPSNIYLGFHISEHACPSVVAGAELEEGDGAGAGKKGLQAFNYGPQRSTFPARVVFQEETDEVG